MEGNTKLFLEDGTYVGTFDELTMPVLEMGFDAIDMVAFNLINYFLGTKDECVEKDTREFHGKKCSECRYFKVCTAKDKES